VNYITLSHIYCKLADTVTFSSRIPEIVLLRELKLSENNKDAKQYKPLEYPLL
jgi:hypothetical protein